MRPDDAGEYLPYLRIIVHDETGNVRVLGGSRCHGAKVNKAMGYGLWAMGKAVILSEAKGPGLRRSTNLRAPAPSLRSG